MQTPDGRQIQSLHSLGKEQGKDLVIKSEVQGRGVGSKNWAKSAERIMLSWLAQQKLSID